MRPGWRVRRDVRLVLQQHIVTRLEGRPGAISATIMHQPIALFNLLLRCNQILHGQGHRPLEGQALFVQKYL